MSKTIENYIEKLKGRVKWLEKCQADYEREKGRNKNYPAGYYDNSTELLTLKTVIRDLTPIAFHIYSYWDYK